MIGCIHKKKQLNYFLFEVQTQRTYQMKTHSSLILNTSLISSIHKYATSSDKVLNQKSKFRPEILMILVSKLVQNYSLFSLYATQKGIFHMKVELNACTFSWYV